MMAQKAKLFHDSERYTAILRSTQPWECKDLGKQVKPFDSNAWDAVKNDVVKTANRAKYEQNPDLKARLLDTGDAILAEASPKDTIWGIGLDAVTAAETNPSEWPGQNLLGKILMELRSEFAGKKAEAAKVAVMIVNQFIEEHPGQLDLVEWVLFDEHTHSTYGNVLNQLQVSRVVHSPRLDEINRMLREGLI